MWISRGKEILECGFEEKKGCWRVDLNWKRDPGAWIGTGNGILEGGFEQELLEGGFDQEKGS